MKKIFLAFAALVAMTACVQDELNPDALVPPQEEPQPEQKPEEKPDQKPEQMPDLWSNAVRLHEVAGKHRQ